MPIIDSTRDTYPAFDVQASVRYSAEEIAAAFPADADVERQLLFFNVFGPGFSGRKASEQLVLLAELAEAIEDTTVGLRASEGAETPAS